MKLDIQFKELEMLVSNMGASQKTWISGGKSEPIKDVWGEKFESIKIEKIFKTTPDNAPFERNGKQFLVYIKEIKKYRNDFSFPKFHFYKCGTLKQKERQNKLNEQYVATVRKDGRFFVDMPNGNNKFTEELKELDVCQNCLRWYNELRETNYTVDNFSIANFFEYFNDTPIINKLTYTDITAPASGYPENWDAIAQSYKERHHWTCEQCGINLKSHRHLLHVHHIEGVKSYKEDSDLKALCVSCHYKQANHQHMETKFAVEISEIARLRSLSRQAT